MVEFTECRGEQIAIGAQIGEGAHQPLFAFEREPDERDTPSLRRRVSLDETGRLRSLHEFGHS